MMIMLEGMGKAHDEEILPNHHHGCLAQQMPAHVAQHDVFNAAFSRCLLSSSMPSSHRTSVNCFAFALLVLSEVCHLNRVHSS